MSQTLSRLFDGFPYPFWGELIDIPVSGISADTRTLKPGEVFIAVEGYTFDSHDFINVALAKGASAVIGSRKINELPVPYIRVDQTRKALSHLAAAFYSFPARKMVMIGVTGTDGKTTVCNLIYHILKSNDFNVGMISTVNAVIGEQLYDTGFHVTTPDAIDVQRYLAEMVATGITHCVLETTSHGWAQHRIDACDFDIAVFTNVTHEHMNEHGNYENYIAAKARLLESLVLARKEDRNPIAFAVLNKDDVSYPYLEGVVHNLATVHLCSYSLLSQGTLNAREIRNEPEGQEFTVDLPGGVFSASSRLSGKFNVSNSLAALGATVIGLDINPELAVQALSDFRGVPGRMERIYAGQDFIAIVDFAHTPNALKNALETARNLAEGRIITVFGSAGLRDKEKRRLMAEVSVSLADITIFTAEDPRTESLEDILDEMTMAAVNAGANLGETLFVVPDRGQAVREAVQLAKRGDLVIVCGKGHEQTMCFGTIEYVWDDRTALRAALAESLNQPGPTMPELPTSN
jgi:UDP-N-acetylmuramoyl-L-alanyl-D-glutamate--2,6-diaminopimelate ligase